MRSQGNGAESRYVFGPFCVETNRRLLLRDGDIVPLTPKAFDVLLALVQRSGEPVSKDDLMKLVWPDSFVEESNLTQTIYALRKALGEQKGERRYIVTIPKRGYQFVLEDRDAAVPSPASTN